MTPKEKAQELIREYMSATNETSDFKMELYYHIQTAKKCAFIAVDEMIDYLVSNLITGTLMTYWQEVKNEIEAL